MELASERGKREGMGEHTRGLARARTPPNLDASLGRRSGQRARKRPPPAGGGRTTAWPSTGLLRCGSPTHALTLSSGYAASTSSITTPFSASSAGGISSRCRMTGVSGPSIAPRATMGANA